MTQPLESPAFLLEEIETGIDGLGRHIAANPPFITLIGLIRELDVQLTIPYQEKLDNPPLSLLYKFGWPLLFRESYRLFDMKPQPMVFASNEKAVINAQMLLTFSGRVGLCQQYLEYLRYGMIKVASIIDREVTFEASYKYFDVERFDADYKSIVADYMFARFTEAREARQPLQFKDVKPLIVQTVTKPLPQFMSYNAPVEVFEYFMQQGQDRLISLQEHENFGDEDVFGGLAYQVYVDAVELITGIALMHFNYALAVLESHPQTLLANLLPYLQPDSSFIKVLVNDINVTEQQARQILDCLTLDKTNYEGYTEFTAAAPPPFVRMSTGHLLRSVAGCLDNPFQLLNYELKRRFPPDYFRAVNNREARFRSDLFKFFQQEDFVKLDRGVRLTTPLGSTDIDAVIYDRNAGTLALIQLKWPDAHGDSLRRRQSVMTNYYGKANEWVEKINSWLEVTEPKDIFGALQIKIPKEELTNFKGSYVFVLNRQTAHFTSGEPSENAAWGSWPQFLTLFSTISQSDSGNLLGAIYSYLRYLDPKYRTDRGDIPQQVPFNMKIGISRIMMNY